MNINFKTSTIMASKTIDHLTLMVQVTPYEHEGMKYDGLLIIVAYHKGRGFVCSWQPVQVTNYGYQTGPLPSSDPLVGGAGFVVKSASRNDAAFIRAMHSRLTEGQAGIRLYFDSRDYERLKLFMATVAEFGYSDEWREKINEIINNQTSSNNKEDQTMATKNINNQNESANVQTAAQVNNEIESVAVGEVSLSSIMPKMTAEPEPTKQEVAEAIVKAAETGEATTKPLGKHGTLVIASGGGESKPKAKKPAKSTEHDPEAVGELAGILTKVTLVTYTTKRGETAPRIIGFSGDDDPRWKPIHDEKQALIAAYNKAKKKDPKAKMTSSPFGPAWLSDRDGNGEKTYCMTFGVKYMEVAKVLCAAYNTNDRDQWAKAEQAVRDQKAGIAAGYQAEREAKRAAREAKKAAVKAEDKPMATGYSKEDVAAMLRDVLSGKALPKEVAELMAA